MLDQIDALCAPALARAAEIKATLEARIKAEAAKALAKRLQLETCRVSVSTMRQTWDTYRSEPAVAALIADGWKMVEVEFENGHREAVMERPRTTPIPAAFK